MANFWSGFTEGFTPTYLNTRARTDRKEELDRARQQLLSDRDIVRQQRLSDMAMDRQQRVDDRDAERAYQARLTAAARKYAEDRERRKIIAAIQSTDPSVSEQARDEAFFAQPREEQEAAAYRGEAREGFKEVSPLGVESSVRPEPSQMRGDVGYRDLGDEGLWGANARAARLQKGADAAKKIRADLAALGNQYGLVQGADEPNSAFAVKIEGAKNKAAVDQAGALARGELDVGLIAEGQGFGITRKENEPPEVFARRVQVAKNEAAITEARKKAAASAGGAKSINVQERATATLGFIRSIDAGGGGDALKNTREAFAERDKNGVIIKGENGEIVDRIDEATGLPEWEVYLASETVHGEMESLAKEWSRYRAVFQKTPAMLPDDVDNRGAAVARLTAEIDGELAKRGTSAQQFDLQQVTIAQNPDDYDEKTVSAAKAYLDLKGGQVTEVYDPETGRKIVSIGKRPTGGGADKEPEPDELDYALLKLNRLKKNLPTDESFVGWIATAKHLIGDKVLTQASITKWADEDRVQYRQDVKEFQVAYTKALNAPDSRMSDNDRKLLLPLAPDVNDSPFVFQAKLNKINETVQLLKTFNESYQGQKSIWDLKPQGIMGLRRQKSEGGKQALNDELAKLIIRERFGKGVDSVAVVTQAKTMYDNEEIDAKEMKFFLKSALQD